MARHEDEDEDAFDERGLLKDGHTTRVSLMMKDGMTDVQRAIAQDAATRRGFDDSAARHQPGPVYCDAAGLERKARAYAEMCDDLQNAWRNPPPLVAPAAAAAPPLRRDTAPARPVYDAAEARRIKAAAYAEMVADMTSAWKGPAR
jgi:hypothetical protein